MSGITRTDIPQPESFAFNATSQEEVKKIMARYPEGRQQSAVMPLLDLAQRQEGWVSRAAMDHIAEMLDMAPVRVYEVVTFYTMYNQAPVGKHFIQVCTNLACQLRGVDEVVKACEKTLGIHIGETTEDGEFTVIEVECAGACVNAPVAQIGDDYYEDLDADSMVKVIEALKRGETPKPGPQTTDRQFSGPAGGNTTLTELKF